MPTHRVRPGESIGTIAAIYGWEPTALWNENHGLRTSRGNPNQLVPGDEVDIPEPRPKHIEVDTGKRHRFRRRGVPFRLRLRLARPEGPRKNRPYVLEVAGQRLTGTTDDTGFLEQWIPPGATTGRLTLGRETFSLMLSHLEPVDTVNGARARLVNLALLNPRHSKSEYVSALRAFQAAQELTVTGELDAATRAALVREHES